MTIGFGLVGLVLWAVDRVRRKREEPTLSELCAAAAFNQQVARKVSHISETEAKKQRQRASIARKHTHCCYGDRPSI